MIRSLTALTFLALFACDRGNATAKVELRHNRTGQGTKVATFGEDSITAEELKTRFAEMSPFARARYQTVEQKKEFVDGIARFEMLAAEAQRRGLASDPEVVHTLKQVMIQKLLKQEYEEKPNPIPDADVQAWYEKHQSDYVKPEMTRLVHVFVSAPEGEVTRKEKRAQAEEVLAKAKTLVPLDFTAFGALAREHSEEPRTKPIDGDMRFLSSQELAEQYGPEVAGAAAQIKNTGDVYPQVVETPKGFHVLKLQGRTQALNLTLADANVKSQIQGYILFERKNQNYAKLLDALKAKAGYKVDEQALAKLEVDLKGPTLETKGPPVGFIPAPVNPAPPTPGAVSTH
ncbi:MAG: peptidylprolyl isomerase [Myxococcaceae bacterium]